MIDSSSDRNQHLCELALIGVEIAAVVVCFLFVVTQTFTLLPYYWLAKFDGSSKEANDAGLELSETEASPLASMFFLWLSPLIRFGHRLSMEGHHPNSSRFSFGDHVFLRAERGLGNKPLLSEIGWLFYAQAVQVGVLSILLACVQLCQPLIIQLLVDFLGRSEAPSIGR
jgi:hypothetical protein